MSGAGELRRDTRSREPRAHGSLLRHPLPPALLVLGLGLAVTASWQTWSAEQNRVLAQHSFDDRAAAATLRVIHTLRGPIEVAEGLASSLNFAEARRSSGFRMLTQDLVDQSTALQGLYWLEHLRAEQRADWEAEHGRSLFEWDRDGRAQTAPSRSAYWVLSLSNREQDPLLGLNLGDSQAQQAWLEALGQSATPRTPSSLGSLPTARGSKLALFTPVSKKGELSSGVLVGQLAGQGGLTQVLRENATHGLTGALFELGPGGKEVQLASSSTDFGAAQGELAWERSFPFVDRSWRLRFRGREASFTSAAGASQIWTLGFCMSSLLALLTYALGRARELRRSLDAARKLGSYTLLEKLGEGGMGSVYREQHALLRRSTAIKLIKRDQVSKEAELRFEREVQVTSQLTHPHTVQIYDYGHTADGTFYYAMEYLEGMNLAQLVARSGPLSAERAVALALQMAGSLAEAHEHELIHRDLKPENILVSRRGGIPDFVTVLDFGLVKELDAQASPALSGECDLVGTPAWMAPETILDPRAVSPRSDVYALGAVLYFMLTGKPVFDGPTVLSILTQAITAQVQPLEEARGSALPQELSQLVMRCLSRAPEARPANARELEQAMEALQLAAAWTRERADEFWALQSFSERPTTLAPEPQFSLVQPSSEETERSA